MKEESDEGLFHTEARKGCEKSPRVWRRRSGAGEVARAYAWPVDLFPCPWPLNIPIKTLTARQQRWWRKWHRRQQPPPLRTTPAPLSSDPPLSGKLLSSVTPAFPRPPFAAGPTLRAATSPASIGASKTVVPACGGGGSDGLFPHLAPQPRWRVYTQGGPFLRR